MRLLRSLTAKTHMAMGQTFLVTDGGLHHQQGSNPILETSPIIIRAVIVARTEHLAEKKSMGRKYLHTVESGSFGSQRGLAVSVGQSLKIPGRHAPDPGF